MSTSEKHETLIEIPAIYIYINRVNNRLAFTIKYGYKLDLQTPETMKLFGRTKKLIGKTKNGENVLSLEVVHVVLVQYNLVHNQYQQKSEVLYTFVPNKIYGYLLNIEPSNIGFLKTYITMFGDIAITFTDQHGRPVEIESKVYLTLLINKKR